VPDEEQHLRFWRSDDALSQRLEVEAEYGWSVTTMFYAALHLIDAVLSRASAHPNSHAARQRAIRNHGGLVQHWADYRLLEDLSRDARYNCVSFTLPLVRRLRAEHFAPLEWSLRAYLEA